MAIATFPCTKCGAELEFSPGTTHLACRFCGAENEIPQASTAVEEIDYQSVLSDLGDEAPAVECVTIHCDSCGANVTFSPNVTSQACPFCGSNVVAAQSSQKVIKPKSLLPFQITREQARDKFRKWLAGLWFAPRHLKNYASVEGDEQLRHGSGLAGMYMPYWTYDCRTITTYTGQRGDDYYVTVPRTVIVNGKSQTRMVMERRTRWTWVQGTVRNAFDDVLVPASTSLPVERVREIGKWDTRELVPYSDGYLAGYRAESYTISLPEGFVSAQSLMRGTIESTIRSDIGGDHQRIADMAPTYRDITFKHILVPIWVSAYRYNGRLFRFLINGSTGEVSGERPYSAWKIAFAVLIGLAALAVAILLLSRR
ncbi:MAG: hypothetical protein JSR77_07665 [Planctomycetes bacterium]|nr:hypothetical protein [Planctomycetota bacterium]